MVSPPPVVTLRLGTTEARAYAGKALPTRNDDAEMAAWAARLIHRLGGPARPHVADGRIVIHWTPDARRPSGPDQVVEWLEAGQAREAAVALELLLSAWPDDVVILYNLGMDHSDMGNLERAEELLRRLLVLEPQHVNTRIALGVALMRQNRVDEAVEELERAVVMEPDNSWANRNLAAALQHQGKSERTVDLLRKAVEQNPEDAKAWAGLGLALEKDDELVEADEAYLKAIDLAGFGEVAEMAEQGRSRIAQITFRENAGGTVRMDAVMYCLGALEKFAAMPVSQVQQIVLEIAVLGQQGLDVNDSTQKYRLKTLPGQFSGLHLVCIMYVGMQQLSPGTNTGFDVSDEYAMAQTLFAGPTAGRPASAAP